jgi:hypothetical protein
MGNDVACLVGAGSGTVIAKRERRPRFVPLLQKYTLYIHNSKGVLTLVRWNLSTPVAARGLERIWDRVFKFRSEHDVCPPFTVLFCDGLALHARSRTAPPIKDLEDLYRKKDSIPAIFRRMDGRIQAKRERERQRERKKEIEWEKRKRGRKHKGKEGEEK